MDKNKIISCTGEGPQRSVSVDYVLYLLFVEHCKTEQRANEQIREFVRLNWGRPSMSKGVQRFLLSKVSRPSLASRVFSGDSFTQGDLF